jgi:hypothetical protein
MAEAHSEEGVARLQESEKDRHVRLRSGMRLHIRMIRTEELLGAIPRKVLDHIHKLHPIF